MENRTNKCVLEVTAATNNQTSKLDQKPQETLR